jgi:hypothetical protein
MMAPAGIVVPAERVADGQLLGGRCIACGVTAYPPPDQCPGCLGHLADIPLSGFGVLYSFSVIHVSSRGSAVPYTVAYVDVPEGARLFAQLDETDDSSLHLDATVRLQLRKDTDGYRAVWSPHSGEGQTHDA